MVGAIPAATSDLERCCHTLENAVVSLACSVLVMRIALAMIVLAYHTSADIIALMAVGDWEQLL